MIKVVKEFKTPEGETFAIELEIDGKLVLIRTIAGNNLEVVLNPFQWASETFVRASEYK